jgi:hypothetical protein
LTKAVYTDVLTVLGQEGIFLKHTHGLAKRKEPA